jgi:glycosyltransferase involved in cell wall biosynthesis
MLVQSALGATSMALKLRRKFKIPIVLRPHGEDIQFVPEVGYGWRLDPAKNEAICDNIKAVDACVAISPRVEELIRTISAETPTVLIPNGVDTAFFTRKNTDVIRLALTGC